MNADPDGMSTARILVVDDNATVRSAIAVILEDEQDLSVCGEAENIADAIALCETRQPDLALIDISLRGESGLELVRHLRERAPDMRTVVFSLHDEMRHIDGARKAGAHGYASKGEGLDALLDCVRTVLKGDSCFATGKP